MEDLVLGHNLKLSGHKMIQFKIKGVIKVDLQLNSLILKAEVVMSS